MCDLHWVFTQWAKKSGFQRRPHVCYVKYWLGGEIIIVKIIFEKLVNNDRDGDVEEF
jgi:hypothetical protein